MRGGRSELNWIVSEIGAFAACIARKSGLTWILDKSSSLALWQHMVAENHPTCMILSIHILSRSFHTQVSISNTFMGIRTFLSFRNIVHTSEVMPENLLVA